jgi:ABC-type histidine transport system ATPase subunit
MKRLVKGVLKLMADLGRGGRTMVVVIHERGFASDHQSGTAISTIWALGVGV